jgi:phosphoribosyl-ATP pyrophosphohydrolase
MNTVEITAPMTTNQAVQGIIKRPSATDGSTTVKIAMKTANEAEAKHTLQYFLLRQKIPPVTNNTTGTMYHMIVNTAEKGIEETRIIDSLRRKIRPRRPNTLKIINIIPAAILILFTYLTALYLYKNTRQSRVPDENGVTQLKGNYPSRK